MAFRFSLQTVLCLRQIAEEREEHAMEEILRNVAQQQQALRSLAAERERFLRQCETALHRKTSAAELLLLHGQIRATADLEAKGRKQLAHLEEKREAQMRLYEAAHRDRELLSAERRQQAEQHRRVQVRKEQLQMDDIFSSRRTRTRNPGVL